LSSTISYGRAIHSRVHTSGRRLSVTALATGPFARRRDYASFTTSHAMKGAHVGIIGWIILGLLAGAIAKAILPGDDPGGIIVTMLIGIVGAIVGGFIASALNIGDLGDFFDIGTWIIAIVGALLLLVAYRAVSGRRTAP
jgi:uncharacterized membrane protein YeaQ/YmgE (transglycosylase-associated protein family)